MDKLSDNVTINYSEKVVDIKKNSDGYVIHTNKAEYHSKNVVVASGGLSLPSIGASDIGIKVGKNLGHKVIETSPSLVPLTLKGDELEMAKSLSGVSLEVNFHINNKIVRDDLLFTHKGISGPATLKGSLYWYPGDTVELDFVPDYTFEEIVKSGRNPKTGKS